MDIVNYLRNASICMALGYLPYLLLFKRLTFFSANRFYLLFIVAASFVIPVLHIKITEPLVVQHINVPVTIAHDVNIETEHPRTAATQQFSLSWMPIAAIAYGIVCLFMLARMFYSIFKIVRQAKLYGIRTGSNCVVQNQHANNSSFFNIIFLNAKNTNSLEMEQVLTHEKAHARLLHSADNLFIETVKAFFWFNPFIYLIAKALKEIHEYEVDQSLKNLFDPKQYASLLITLSTKPSISLVNQFSAYSLKARITMLFKPHSSAYKKWCYLLTLPVLLITGYWFSVERVYAGTHIKKDFVLVLDAGHGGNNTGARGVGGHKEKDLTLLLVKQIKLAADQRGIKTILTRSGDESIDMYHRVNNKADVFISVHMNMTYLGLMDKKSNGMSILVSRKQALYPLSEKLAASVKASLQQLKGVNQDHEIELNYQQNLYTVGHTKAPAILIEMGFITNQNDVDYVLNPHTRQAIAEKVIDGVMAFGNEK